MSRICCLLLMCIWTCPAACGAGMPVIYSTDLYHPHDDPDDHFDLATPVAARTGSEGHHHRHGKYPTAAQSGTGEEARHRWVLPQMFHLSGKTVPFATGLDQAL